jgi:hypothetical protein
MPNSMVVVCIAFLIALVVILEGMHRHSWNTGVFYPYWTAMMLISWAFAIWGLIVGMLVMFLIFLMIGTAIFRFGCYIAHYLKGVNS